MNLCSSDHDEICFEGRSCPLCAKVEEMQETIRGLESKVDDLKSENDTLSEQLAEAENGAST